MTDEESLHLRYYRKTVRQMWKVVLIGIILAVLISVGLARLIAHQDVLDLKRYIDESQNRIGQVQASGNKVVIERSPTHADLVREVLEKEGKVSAK